MAIDKDAIREHVRGILAALGDDPDREGLKETPDRVARMYEEVFEGMNYTNHEIAMMFNKSFKDDLCVGADKKDIVLYPPVEIPTPVIYVAIQAKTKQDEDKISSALQKLNLEEGIEQCLKEALH